MLVSKKWAMLTLQQLPYGVRRHDVTRLEPALDLDRTEAASAQGHLA